jgi:GT2 family glycosyltransferase
VSESDGTLPRISVIIVNWNGRRYLETCLRSLLSVDYPEDKLEILLVDNGSTDESILFVKTSFPVVKILELDANYGFCRPNNEGARVVENAGDARAGRQPGGLLCFEDALS